MKCPECDFESDSEFGISTHFGQAHNGTLTEEHPSFDPSQPDFERAEVTCENCGSVKRVTKSVLENRDQHFCNYECYNKWLSSGNAPMEREDVVESISGDSNPAKSDKVKQQISQSMTGELNHMWRGGHGTWVNTGESKYWIPDKNYGDNWGQVRSEILERDDGHCLICSDTTDLIVHHIVPLREFDSVESANQTDNLVTLCRSCHPTIEQLSTHEQEKLFGD